MATAERSNFHGVGLTGKVISTVGVLLDLATIFATASPFQLVVVAAQVKYDGVFFFLFPVHYFYGSSLHILNNNNPQALQKML